MANDLAALNNHLFAQLDRLTKDGLSEDQIAEEVKRANAVVAVSDQIVGAQKLRLDAAKLFAQHGQAVLPHLPMIGSDKGDGDA